jgi:hypothetical protein
VFILLTEPWRLMWVAGSVESEPFIRETNAWPTAQVSAILTAPHVRHSASASIVETARAFPLVALQARTIRYPMQPRSRQKMSGGPRALLLSSAIILTTPILDYR